MFLLSFQLMKPEQLEISQTLDFLAEDPDLRLAIVFGSIADGSHRPDSDIDVAVYARNKMDPRKRQQLSDDIAAATGRTVDLIDLHSVDGALLRQILHSGRIVFSKEPSTLGILSERLLDWQENFEPQLNNLLITRLRRFTSPIHGS
jgi:predicted nucleotidyltransferase